MGFKATSYLITGVVILVLIIAVAESRQRHENMDCDCHYQTDKRGCVITRGPAQAGFKCRCRISRFFLITHCIGTRIGCNTGENCPAGCASKDCCVSAGGNCDGY